MKVENGVMQMREVADGLPIPAGGSVVLKPGSHNVMLIGLKKPLTAGEKFPLTLTFEKAGNISVTVPVQAMGATQDKGGMSGMGGMQDGKSGGGMGNMEMK
jgi:copper(I)-binding protein